LLLSGKVALQLVLQYICLICHVTYYRNCVQSFANKAELRQWLWDHHESGPNWEDMDDDEDEFDRKQTAQRKATIAQYNIAPPRQTIADELSYEAASQYRQVRDGSNSGAVAFVEGGSIAFPIRRYRAKGLLRQKSLLSLLLAPVKDKDTPDNDVKGNDNDDDDVDDNKVEKSELPRDVEPLDYVEDPLNPKKKKEVASTTSSSTTVPVPAPAPVAIAATTNESSNIERQTSHGSTKRSLSSIDTNTTSASNDDDDDDDDGDEEEDEDNDNGFTVAKKKAKVDTKKSAKVQTPKRIAREMEAKDETPYVIGGSLLTPRLAVSLFRPKLTPHQ
jgi:hypothetical protein